MILADIWAELGRYGLQFLRSIHLGPNSSHYNYLAVFSKGFTERVQRKEVPTIPLTKAVPGVAWAEAVTSGGRGRGGRGRGCGRGRGRSLKPGNDALPVDSPPVEVPTKEEPIVVETPKNPPEPLPVEQDSPQPSPPTSSALPNVGEQEITLKGSVSGTSFTLRPFFVSTEFDFKTRSGVSIVPHIIVMYPRNQSVTSLQYKKWLEAAVQALVTADVLPVDCCRIITDVLDKEHLRRVETNNAFIQFKANVPHEARNAAYAILRHSLWFFSLPTDSFDPTVIQATSKASRVLCQWKIARNHTTSRT